ncbi:MAG: (2Fe-2S)-binding protein [Verrucomicrobiae bacterium]|nr:(2Fe-2S)-binding protein [Verrucomicrobiae bacterium]
MATIRFSIDDREVEVEEGQTVLDGARRAGVDIPTLCHLERCGPLTTCLACVVKVVGESGSRIVPSCATRATEGLRVQSETAEVRELRRSALELLLSDHVGDCLSPCSRICPLGLDIPRMLREVRDDALPRALATVRETLPLPGVLGRLCHHPCENGCRRSSCDGAAAIRDVERFVAEAPRDPGADALPVCRPASGRRVAVVGAGPAGLAAAWRLVRAGHACEVFDRGSRVGGTLWEAVERGKLPEAVLRRDVADLERLGVRFRTGWELGREATLSDLKSDHDAVLLTVGTPTREAAEGWGVGCGAGGIRLLEGEGYRTCVPGVFAAGSAVKGIPQVVRAMAEGRRAADAIDAALAGRASAGGGRVFSSVMGRLEAAELQLFLEGASAEKRIPVDASAVYGADEARRESARCLHCDCRAAGNCRLQRYSALYGAEFGRFPRQRRAFEQQRHPARVLFEPGKCILCGICVVLAERAAEPLGLTFVGRGFEVRVAAPMGEGFDRGLQKAAVECAEACPTGAIRVEDGAGADS